MDEGGAEDRRFKNSRKKKVKMEVIFYVFGQRLSRLPLLVSSLTWIVTNSSSCPPGLIKHFERKKTWKQRRNVSCSDHIASRFVGSGLEAGEILLPINSEARPALPLVVNLMTGSYMQKKHANTLSSLFPFSPVCRQEKKKEQCIHRN